MDAGGGSLEPKSRSRGGSEREKENKEADVVAIAGLPRGCHVEDCLAKYCAPDGVNAVGRALR